MIWTKVAVSACVAVLMARSVLADVELDGAQAGFGSGRRAMCWFGAASVAILLVWLAL